MGPIKSRLGETTSFLRARPLRPQLFTEFSRPAPARANVVCRRARRSNYPSGAKTVGLPRFDFKQSPGSTR